MDMGGGDADEYFQMAFDDDGADLASFDQSQNEATAYVNEIDSTNSRERPTSTDAIGLGDQTENFSQALQNIEAPVQENLPLKRRYYTNAVEWYMRQAILDETPAAKKFCHENSEKILDKLRKKNEDNFGDGDCKKIKNPSYSSIIDTAKRRSIFQTVPIHTCDWTAISGVGYLGARYYVTHKRDYDHTTSCKSKSQNLLGKPIQDLLDEAHLINTARDHLNDLTECDDLFLGTENISEKKNDKNNHLWVEKYKPRLFIDLLSDDGINRTLLTWLKLWDGCVFGTKTVISKRADTANQFNFKKKDETNNKFSKFKKKDIEIPLDMDKLGRPQHKVALLCGPPGLGKTTLATVVCRHAGYHLVEMNASDDRSVDVFRNNIQSATQMKCTLDSDPRPNCLLIDEIDGAPAPSINYLVSLLQGELSSKSKSKEKQTLRRPILCICNDLYTPALRELRKIALVLHFPTTSQKKLSDRLAQVCRFESLSCEMKALQVLCEKSAQDIRTCLNTLQFASSKSKHEDVIDIDCIKNLGIGQKDNQSSLFNVWHMVFHRKKNSPKWRQELLSATYSAGDGDKLRQGIFENYPLLKDQDGKGVIAAAKGMEWMVFADCMSRFISRTQVYDFMIYQSYVPIVFHNLFASNNYTRIQFPHTMNEMVQKRNKSESIVESLVESAEPRMKQFASKMSIAYDIAPHIMQILVPNIRLVNTELYGQREKAELSRVVDCMLYFGLQYRQQIASEGHYQFLLQPAMEDLALFGDVSRRNGLAQTARLLISRELGLEKIRRNEAASYVVNPENTSIVQNQGKNICKQVAKVQSPTKVQQVFGSKQPIAIIRKKHSTDIWYKFNEGYSNAIRRNIKMKDLL